MLRVKFTVSSNSGSNWRPQLLDRRRMACRRSLSDPGTFPLRRMERRLLGDNVGDRRGGTFSLGAWSTGGSLTFSVAALFLLTNSPRGCTSGSLDLGLAWDFLISGTSKSRSKSSLKFPKRLSFCAGLFSASLRIIKAAKRSLSFTGWLRMSSSSRVSLFWGFDLKNRRVSSEFVCSLAYGMLAVATYIFAIETWKKDSSRSYIHDNNKLNLFR